MIKSEPRDKVLSSRTIKVSTPCGDCYVIVSFKNGAPTEIFIKPERNNSCMRTWNALTGQLISDMLRIGFDPMQVYKRLKGQNCDRSAWNEGEMSMSCHDAFAWGYKQLWELEEADSDQLSFKLDDVDPSEEIQAAQDHEYAA